VRQQLKYLEPKDSYLLINYYGLNGIYKSQAEIGREFGVSREAVRKRRERILIKITRVS
jgi:DNA-directed RNA polymerase sigma subunit (sigma70/sigma32)